MNWPMLRRRALFASALLALPLTRTAMAQAQDMRRALESAIDDLRRAASRHRLTGSWDEPGIPIRANLLPPASEASLAALEGRIGAKIPPALRQFFRHTTAGIDILWLIPGQRRITASGSSTVEYALAPPPPFGEPGIPPDPVINAGGLRIMLDDIEGMRGEWEWWRDARREGEAQADDPVTRAHEHYHAAMWQRGFPIARTMGGDIIAIDTTDPLERLIVLRHDGDDAPALLLGHDLPTHLAHQARLGFVGFEMFRMELFVDQKQSEQAIADFAPTVEELIQEHDLFLPQACVIDSATENGQAWQKWMKAQ